ncbi:tetraacyldisaccharide 4'-kinase [Desulfocastanea catecholica]
MSKGLELFFPLGRPFAPLYSAVMKAREKLYISGVFRRHELSIPVISIGNLVLGGSGKTPTVQHLARLLSANGYHPAIVSRGHGGKAGEVVNIVSDGENIFLTALLAGDEPYMLAESLPGVPVLTGTRRILPCRQAVEQFSSNVIILDDGFQHLGVKRDIDIVLFDGTALAGNSRVFPGGPLREPISALHRCHAFLLTGQTKTNHERTKKFSELLQQKFPDRPVFISNANTSRLQGSDGSVVTKHGTHKYFGFCGIANPSRFEKSLTDLGIQLRGFQTFKDHVQYSQTMVANICQKAVEAGATSLVTTEKDFVKLRSLSLQLPLYVLHIEHKVDEFFDRFILDSLKKSVKASADARRAAARDVC